MAVLISFALHALLSSRLVLGQDLPPQNLPIHFTGPNVLDYGVNGGLNAVPSTPYTRTQWPWGTIPENCMLEIVTNRNKCNPYDIEVYELSYEDCPASDGRNKIRVCRCHDAQMSIDDISYRLGQLAPRARAFIRDVHVVSQDSGCVAWALFPDLLFLGACAENHSLQIHEVAHHIDGYGNPGLGGFSNTQNWKDAVKKGSCITDNYAKRSWQECFSQFAVLAAYNANVQPIWNHNVGCMADAVGLMIEKADYFFRKGPGGGTTCEFGWNKKPKVCMGPAARASGNCPNLRVAQVEGSGDEPQASSNGTETCSLGL